jgi:hypothetical protein
LIINDKLKIIKKSKKKSLSTLQILKFVLILRTLNRKKTNLKMKKITFALAACVVFAFAACGNNATEETTTDSTATDSTAVETTVDTTATDSTATDSTATSTEAAK